MTRHEYVYAVRAPSVKLVKVGQTISPRSRFQCLAAGSPVSLEVAYCFRMNEGFSAGVVERRLFTILQDLNRWAEWFDDDPRINVAFAALRNGSHEADVWQMPTVAKRKFTPIAEALAGTPA